MSSLPFARLPVAIGVALQLATASVVGGQVAGRHGDEHSAFECTEDGLTRQGSTGLGCQLLAKNAVAAFPDAPIFWHLATFPTEDAAESAKGQIGFVADAESKVWLFSFGPKDAAPKQGAPTASVGPLQLPSAKSYEIVAYFVVMPAGAQTATHTHSGPEAWYILEGTQCLETPAGESHAAAGGSMVAPPNTPMQLTNPGPTLRRALFIVIHDASKPWVSPSNWKPTGRCLR